MTDHQAQLQEKLTQLSPKEALALARGIELKRVMGQEELPTEAILSALRPQLRTAQAPRVPTLMRLICRAWDDFLTDRVDEPRLPGLVPRLVLPRWWHGLGRLFAAEMEPFQDRLRRSIAAGDDRALQELAAAAETAAIGWTDQLVAAVGTSKGDKTLRQLFADQSLLADLRELAHLLHIAEPLRSALQPVLQVLASERLLDGRRILDLSPVAVTVAKQQYVAMSERHGLDSRYVALALLNRLVRPWHVLRLGRALSWKPDDSLMHDTEFGVVGERLVIELQRISDSVLALLADRRRLPGSARLAAQLERYMEEAEGLLGEFGFRRQSSWGERILRTRIDVSGAFDRELLDLLGRRLLALMPSRAEGGLDLGFTPDRPVIDEALDTARFLVLLQHRGARHGLGHAVREQIDRVRQAIDDRATGLIENLRLDPENAAAAAQIEAAAQVSEIMFETGHSQLMLRRMRNARQILA